MCLNMVMGSLSGYPPFPCKRAEQHRSVLFYTNGARVCKSILQIKRMAAGQGLCPEA